MERRDVGRRAPSPPPPGRRAVLTGWLLYAVIAAGTLGAFVAVIATSVWRYRRNLRGRARAMLRERSLEDCLADIDDKLAAARRAPVDARAARVEVGLLEHMRTALLQEAGKE